MTKTIKTALIGLGNVNRSFLQLIQEKEAQLRREYQCVFQIICVADSSGVAIQQSGFEPTTLRRYKEGGGKVADLAGYQRGFTPAQVLETLDCDLVLEASPVNLQTGEPGLNVVRMALQRGIPCVLANKGPMVLAFHELHDLAAQHHTKLAFSATVCGALPVLNIGRRDLVVAQINRLQGIFNATSNFILGAMSEGQSYSQALAETQRRGIAETDPTLDVEGWDTANKLVIIANSMLGVRVGLQDVQVQGITGIEQATLQAEVQKGNTIKLLATAQRQAEGHFTLSVTPTLLSKQTFLGSCDGFEMGVEIHTDIYGIQYLKVWEDNALPTAAAMLRDAVHLMTE